MADYYCDFSNPVDYQGNAPALPTDFWQFKNSVCISSSSIASSSDQLFLGGFSAGEIVASTFLFLIFLVIAFSFLFFWLKGFKIKKY